MTIALFPGRFQPPHIGHILTLMRLYPLYDEIIVAVTSYTFDGKKPHIIEPCEAAGILREVFRFLPKLKVVCVGKGFIERVNFSDLPRFDVVVSGDPLVLQNMRRFGIKCLYVSRSVICGMEISATLLREILNDAGQA